MPTETYPCYVRISEGPESDEVIELPTEGDGKLMLTTITAQFPDAIGLRFKSDSGAWRGMRFIDGALEPPLEGWGYNDYFITTGGAAATTKKAEKRKLDQGPSHEPAASKSKQDLLSDLIVLGLPYAATEEDLRSYFEKYGELSHCELKMDPRTKRSKGFGFIRFQSESAAQEALDSSHTLGGRKLDVRFPYKHSPYQDNNPTKLFVGRLPAETTVEELREVFNDYGPLKDVYIPQNFRGFGFVTFASHSGAQAAMNATHQLRGNFLNLSHPQPKPGDRGTVPVGAQPQQIVYSDGTVQALPGGIASVPGLAQYILPQATTSTSDYSSSGGQTRGGYYTTGYVSYQQQQQQQQPQMKRERWNR